MLGEFDGTNQRKTEKLPQFPTQKEQILKLMKKPKTINPVYYTHCPKCDAYTENCSIRSHQKICSTCANELRPNETNYFVFLPIEYQIKKSIENNWAHLKTRTDSNDMTDVCDGEIVKQIEKKIKNSHTTVCSMTLNFDGASRYKSNNLSLWPIQLVQNFLPPSIRYDRKNIIIAGLYYGKHKPDCLAYFLPLVNELKGSIDRNIEMQLNGLHIRVLPVITHCVLDLPAKAHFQQTTQYNGKNGCTYCLHPGCQVKGSNKSGIRYTVRIPADDLRTQENTLLAMHKSYKTKQRVDGIKGISCIVSLPHFNPIFGFCLDYMHNVCLGVVPNMIKFWCSTSNKKERYHISEEKQLILNERLLSLKPPREFSRRPRSLNECCKANEWRSLLLFTLPMCLENILPKTFIDHFRLLSYSIFTLLKTKFTAAELKNCENKLNRFVSLFQQYYGDVNMTMNVHLLTHIAQCVRQSGPLWAQSAFAYESFNAVLLNHVNGTTDILCQITSKYIYSKQLSTEQISKEKRIELLGLPANVEIKNVKYLNVFKRLRIGKITYTSLLYARPKKSADYLIRLRNNSIGAIQFFFQRQSEIFLSYIQYENVINNVNCVDDQFLEIRKTEKIATSLAKDISHKLIMIETNSKVFVSYFPNEFEKD